MPRALSIAAVLFAGAAWAADAVDVSLSGQALAGQGYPAVIVDVYEPIKGFELRLQRSDGQAVRIGGKGKPNTSHRLELRQPEGRFHYKGELLVLMPDGSKSSLPLEFDAELFGPPKISFDKKDFDLKERRMVFRLSRPASHAEVKVLMDTGQVAFDGRVGFGNAPAGSPLEVTWPDAPGRVMKIELRAYDTMTYFSGIELFPWQVDIPHEEVNFDTNKWDVRADQAPKLDNSLRQIVEAVRKFGHLATLRLYVAGHTDTVGTTESNRTLSLNRARSISAWFRKRGLRIPVYYEGFGEEALMISTPDNTDEPRNRRAEYIIAVEDPVLKVTPFPPKWRKL